MAKDGRIDAVKSGRQWLVNPANLARPRVRRRVAARSPFDLTAALNRVRRTDLTDEWVPDVLRHADTLSDEASLLASATEILEARDPGAAFEVEVDKTAIFTRWGILLTVADRIAYDAAVASFAPRADAQTPDTVFSARLSKDPKYLFLRGTKQWVRWRRHVLGLLDSGNEWMVKTDLTAYFDTIPHKLLVAEIETLNADPHAVSAVEEMLRNWAPVPGMGLPQGPNVSRLLGNLYMLPVDRAMLVQGWHYSRFMDDIRIVAPTKSQAVAAIRKLQEECRSRALIVSSSKTQLLFGDEARADLTEQNDLSFADYLMEARASALAKKELKTILRRALRSKLRVDERRAKFSLWRLAQLLEGGVLGQVLQRLDDLAPLASVVAAYLRPFIKRKKVVDGLAAFLGDRSRTPSDHLVTWLLAAMLEYPGTLPASWADEAAVRVKDKNRPGFLRAVAAVVMARGGRPADVSWIKADIQREHNPVVLRGYAVALHWIRELDRTTQKRLVARSPQLNTTVTYLQGRNTLPSLVARSESLRIS
jgi:hypothetical protein